MGTDSSVINRLHTALVDAFLLGLGDAFLLAFLDHCSFELGDRIHDAQHQLLGWIALASEQQSFLVEVDVDTPCCLFPHQRQQID